MRNLRTVSILLLAALGAAVGALMAHFPGSALSRAELKAQDLAARRTVRTPANPKLIFLAIDSESVGLDANADLQALFGIHDLKTPEARALQLMSQRWPWQRSVYALVLDRLMAAGARVVAFDLIFPTPSEDDDVLRQALDRYRDRVVIGSNFTSSRREDRDAIDAALTQPATTLIPASATGDDRVGFVNFWPDTDGVIRRSIFRVDFSRFLGARSEAGDRPYGSLAAQAMQKAGFGGHVPPDEEAHLFRYTALPGQGFAPHSIFEIFVPEYWERNYRSGAIFAGATVIVGSAGDWQHDEHETPFGTMSGPEIQLNVMNAVEHRSFLRPAPEWGAILLYLFASLLAAGASLLLSGPVTRIATLIGLGAAWGAAQMPLANHLSLLIPVIGPIAVIELAGLYSLLYDLVRSGAEQLRLRLTLQERKRAQEQLEQVNAQLEARVTERTGELRAANSALTQSLEEKNVLLKEIHHRVKNNLQVISSLLNLQSNHITDPAALQIFTESRYRVRSMALIHEKLYQSSDLAKIDFADYLKALTSGLTASFGSRSSPARISLETEQIMLGVDTAVPCGLIVNELVTNCIKYAFVGRAPGEIRIGLKHGEPGQLQLTVSDDGVGFPKGLDFRNTESLGMQLVTTLAEQIDGTVSLQNGCGTTFAIQFPELSKRP